MTGKHRVRATRNLGMNPLKQKLWEMSPDLLEALTWRPINSRLHHFLNSIHSVPLGLLRSEAKLILFYRNFLSGLLDYQKVMKRSCNGYQKMLSSVRTGQRPSKMPSGDCYDWVSQHLHVPAEYCERTMLQAHQLLSEQFPRDTVRVTSTVFGGNQIGSTQSV